MARSSTTFKKGEAKGKPVGAVNKTTKEAKELLEKILFGQLDNANEAFEKLRKDPAKFIDAYSKLLGYVLPKKTDIEGGFKGELTIIRKIIKSNG